MALKNRRMKSLILYDYFNFMVNKPGYYFSFSISSNNGINEKWEVIIRKFGGKRKKFLRNKILI